MNYRTLGLASMGVLLSCTLLFGATLAQAADRVPLSEAHTKRIVSACTSAHSSLNQLHRSDTSLRVNRGRLYEFVSSKLMARLNGRLALNQFDAGELVKITTEYGKAVNEFRDAYYDYETQLSAVLRIDCAESPEDFYYGVLETREKRQVVQQQVSEVNELAGEYYKEFDQLRGEYSTALKGVIGG